MEVTDDASVFRRGSVWSVACVGDGCADPQIYYDALEFHNVLE